MNFSLPLTYAWDHIFWEVLRFYISLRGNDQKNFLHAIVDPSFADEKFPIWRDLLKTHKSLLSDLISYCSARGNQLTEALAKLRHEEESMSFCTQKDIPWKFTQTQNKGHHQSSKTLIATVSAIAKEVCDKHNLTFDANPQKRCVWFINQILHVSARNLDGAIPSLSNPKIVWEIKEYWGKTSGGSKMSDAVYECQLVGKEIREYERKTGKRIRHIVFVDGKDQWLKRKSDLARFLDLENQGLIDRLFIGNDVEIFWAKYLEEIILEDK